MAAGNARSDVRIEVVTAALCAAGSPDGIYDLHHLLDHVNNAAGPRHVELREPSLRPLYKGEPPLALDVPLLIRRDQIIFASFDGPAGRNGAAGVAQMAVPVLLIAPPFQIQGDVFFTPEADTSRALRALVHGFFCLRHARIFDVDGAEVGGGDYVIVNGAAVEMTSATAKRIAPAARATAPQRVRDDAGVDGVDAAAMGASIFSSRAA